MGVISLDHAEPSMVLAEPVKDRNGRLLIPAGNVLSERHIESMRMWGIMSLSVEGASPGADEGDQIDPEVVMEAEESVGGLFSTNDLTHPFVSALSRYCVRRKAQDLHKGRTAQPPIRQEGTDGR